LCKTDAKPWLVLTPGSAEAFPLKGTEFPGKIQMYGCKAEC